jgi:apolipoprotein D and lipocalin family protein
MATLDLAKYMGRWYELVHYPSWFERNDDYNTRANYELNPDGTVCVINTTITRGKDFETHGRAHRLGEFCFRVDFPPPEIAKLVQSGEFTGPMPALIQDPTQPNYVVDRIWTNCHGEYIFAVVTDPQRQSLYVLSRYQHPSRLAYSQVMDYVTTHFDRDRLVQVPHFD